MKQTVTVYLVPHVDSDKRREINNLTYRRKKPVAPKSGPIVRRNKVVPQSARRTRLITGVKEAPSFWSEQRKEEYDLRAPIELSSPTRSMSKSGPRETIMELEYLNLLSEMVEPIEGEEEEIETIQLDIPAEVLESFEAPLLSSDGGNCIIDLSNDGFDDDED